MVGARREQQQQIEHTQSRHTNRQQPTDSRAHSADLHLCHGDNFKLVLAPQQFDDFYGVRLARIMLGDRLSKSSPFVMEHASPTIKRRSDDKDKERQMSTCKL